MGAPGAASMPRTVSQVFPAGGGQMVPLRDAAKMSLQPSSHAV